MNYIENLLKNKVMTQEEKAKRFDEVVEEFRGLLDGVHEDKCDIMEEDILKIVPELKISEDEKIRNEIIVYLSTADDKELIPYESWIAWLERQKPTTDIQNLTWEDIEKIGEFINMVQNENPNGIGAECLYTDVLERFLDGKQTKQKPVEWSEDYDGKISELKTFIAKCNGFNRKNREIAFSMIDSLKPQSNWKPSEEHIRYLQAVVNDVHNIGSESCSIALRDLLEQLKKIYF